MSAQYRLVFQGEVSADQHVAVVRKRLAKLLKANDATLETLFSGQPVVLRKAIDAAGAAKFQSAFKQAGAKLRVQPLNAGSPSDGAAAGPPAQPPATGTSSNKGTEPDAAANRAAEGETEQNEHGWRLLPVGSYLLEVHEQLPPVTSTVAVEHLSVAELGSQLGPVLEWMEDADALLAVAADFQLAEAGARLGAVEGTDENLEASAAVAAPELPLAEAGADLLTSAERPPEPTALPAPDLSGATFDPHQGRNDEMG